MNLSKTSQYALKILNYLVLNEGETITSQILHDKLKIPYQYLRRLLTKLSNKGLIKGGKGRKGGYVIAKHFDKISIADILAATGETEVFSSCIFGFENCLLAEKCKIHEKWAEARDNLLHIMQSTLLSDLKTNKPKKIKRNKVSCGLRITI